jgi:hypothetical protein
VSALCGPSVFIEIADKDIIDSLNNTFNISGVAVWKIWNT